MPAAASRPGPVGRARCPVLCRCGYGRERRNTVHRSHTTGSSRARTRSGGCGALRLAWARRYQSPDGSLRQSRFFRFGTAGERTRDPAQLAIRRVHRCQGHADIVAADWADPFCPRDTRPVERVVEAGCADGSRAVLVDGTPGQADTLYACDGRSRVRGMIRDGAAKPGAACAQTFEIHPLFASALLAKSGRKPLVTRRAGPRSLEVASDWVVHPSMAAA